MVQNIDKSRVHARFLKGLYSYNQHAVVQARMAEHLVEQIRQFKTDQWRAVLEIGCGSGLLTERFLKTFPAAMYYANDLVGDCRYLVKKIVNQYPPSEFAFLTGDIESLPDLPEGLELILSNATFQWLEELDEFFHRIRQHLAPGGLLAFTTFGPRNLWEIKTLTGSGLTYLPCEELRDMLARHFQVLVCEETEETLSFSSPAQALRHLRLTGVNGVSRQQWTKSDLQQFEQQYRARFEDQGRVPLTYHPIFCVVKAVNQ